MDFYGSPSQQQAGSGGNGGSGSGSAAPEQKYRPPSGGLGRMNSGELGGRLATFLLFFFESIFFFVFYLFLYFVFGEGRGGLKIYIEQGIKCG